MLDQTARFGNHLPQGLQTAEELYQALPDQTDLINVTRKKDIMSVLDAARCFYQWLIHQDDRHRMAVITHRGQKIFNVCLMDHRNSAQYVQRQMELILHDFLSWIEIYIDDMIVADEDFDTHCEHLHQLLSTLQGYGIHLEPKKAFVGFPTVLMDNNW